MHTEYVVQAQLILGIATHSFPALAIGKSLATSDWAAG